MLRLERYMYRCNVYSIYSTIYQLLRTFKWSVDLHAIHTKIILHRQTFAYKFVRTLVGPADRRPLPNRYRPFRSLSNFRVGFRFFLSKPVLISMRISRSVSYPIGNLRRRPPKSYALKTAGYQRREKRLIDGFFFNYYRR